MAKLSNTIGQFSIKRLAVWFGLFLCSFLLRGWLFRRFFTYHAEKRFVLEYTIENPQLTDFILKHPEVYDRNVEDIRNIALIAEKITADALYFSKESTVFNPNSVFSMGGATNDAGYSVFFTTVCDYLIDFYGLKTLYDCRHIIGSCHFMKTNLTTFKTLRGGQPFPPEFHFNIIVNLKTGEVLSFDPSLFDSYRISTVSSNYPSTTP
jgi:hypothetical protein